MNAFPFAILLGATLTVLGCFLWGRMLLCFLALRLTRLEGILFSFLVGAGIFSSLVFLLCSMHLARKGVFIACVLVALTINIRMRFAEFRTAPILDLSSLQKGIAAAIYIGYGTVYFINAMAPEYSPDGATYHLGNVARWWELRGFDSFTGSIYSDWSQGFELLFLVAFSIGRHSAAALVHCAFLLLLPWLFFAYGQRIGKVWPLWVAGLFIFVSPVVGKTGSTAYNDVAVACVLFGLFYLLDLWRETGDWKLIVCAGILAGFGFAIKYTAGLGFVYGLILIVWAKRGESAKVMARQLLYFGSAAGAISLPWLVRNYLLLGNPFSPFFNSLFPNPYVHISFESEYTRSMALYSEIGSRWELPWYWSVGGNYVGGIFGPWILLLPLCFLLIRDSLVRKFLFAAVFMGAAAGTNCGTRFLLPFIIFAAPAFALLITKVRYLGAILLLVHGVASLPFLLPLYAGDHTWRIDEFPWRAALRLDPEDAFLTQKMGAYPVARAADRLLPLNAQIFATFQLPLAYTTRRFWHNWQSAEAELGFGALLYGRNPSAQDGWDIGFHFAGRELLGLRVVSAKTSSDQWSVAEVNYFSNGKSVPRNPRWQVTSNPNHWDARFAFDLSDATSWSTWQPTKEGMFVESDFGGPVSVDEVHLISANGQWNGQWRIEGLGTSGKWEVLTTEFKIREREKTKGARFASGAALKSMGFTYVVVNPDDDLGKDISKNWRYWGLELVERVGDATIFRLR